MELAILVIGFVAPLVMKFAERMLDKYFPPSHPSEEMTSGFDSLLNDNDFNKYNDYVKLEGEQLEPEG